MGSNRSAGAVAFWSATVADGVVGAGTASATITINTDGTTSQTLEGEAATAGPNWYEPTTTGIGDSFTVTATATGSTLTTGTLGTAQDLTAARSWKLELTTNGTRETYITFDLKRSGVSEGTGSVTLSVEKEP
jgi:hypothetical protein